MRRSALDDKQSAILAMLLLRGPQTIGELRTRTERMAQLGRTRRRSTTSSNSSPHSTSLSPANVGRRPGQKEERWTMALVGFPVRAPVPRPKPRWPHLRAGASQTESTTKPRH